MGGARGGGEGERVYAVWTGQGVDSDCDSLMVESIARFRAEYYSGRTKEIKSERDCWGEAIRGLGSHILRVQGVHGDLRGFIESRGVLE